MPGALIERPKMTKTMYQALKRHIMKEREKKKQEQEQDAMIERRKKEAELRKKKEQEDSLTLEQTKEQIVELEKKLETLKTEKHELFSQLKKVLHQEDESRKRAALKEQSEIHIMQQMGLPHAAMSGRPMLYRPPQPMVTMAGIKRPRSPSPPPSSVYQQYPESKIMAVAAGKQHHYTHPQQPEYKQSSYPQNQPGQSSYVSQSGHSYQQPTSSYATSKSPAGKYNPSSQSAFTSYPTHYSQQQKMQETYPGYAVPRVQQPGYVGSQHGPSIPLQQQLEHANQKSGFNEEKYKMQQVGREMCAIYFYIISWCTKENIGL
ncbi:hypothetical protein FSP39_013705 [Pinctada imbricata]|uniref:G protein pathway suppressor 2 n=1 Tax=Pinctada imbricata TaxID=66713 RepID=A0AA88YW49_PINIB|nr:hypothetical protein FSP39_013705 [Pinctada imbricata]